MPDETSLDIGLLFYRNLNSKLQSRHRKVISRPWTQPQSEILKYESLYCIITVFDDAKKTTGQKTFLEFCLFLTAWVLIAILEMGFTTFYLGSKLDCLI
jgi:hypothetical protein